jgi:hypothetical protein
MDAFLEALNHQVDYVANGYSSAFLFIGGSFFLLFHFLLPQTRNQTRALFVVGSLAILTMIAIAFSKRPLSIWRVLSLCYVCGIVGFAGLSQLLKDGLAARLTIRRGEKWVKELDYVYVLLGSLGIIAAANRLSFITNKLEITDGFAPLVLTTAVVIRLIKTRVEIGGWARLNTTSKKKRR